MLTILAARDFYSPFSGMRWQEMNHTKLKKAMLAVLGRDGLKRIVEDLEIEDADRRSDESMRAAVSRARRATAEIIAEYLYETEVKEVCQALGVSDTGRRAAVIERLLGSIDRDRADDSDQHPETTLAVPATEAQPAAPKMQRPSRQKPSARPKNNGANLGFERELWQAADALRSNMDAAEYKHVVLGLIFLKYISDAFEEKHAELETDRQSGADPEDPDEYRAVNIFWVPHEARWRYLLGQAKDPKIGKIVDDAMLAIERDNPTLKGVLPKDYAHPRLDKQRLGQLIDLIGNIGLGDKENRSKDILGRVYEYFISQFASAEGKKGGQFYTPRCIVQVLVEMLSPYKGRVYDPCCGSGGMFVQSVEFVNAHVSGNGNGGKVRADISIFGQESNHTTWRLAKMNLAIRQIENNLGREHADSFHRDLHPDLRADFVLANPPFNDSDWRGELLNEDKRWKYGTPPAGNANFAWVQHFIHHLAPTGLAGFVLANGSMSSNQSGEGEIRKAIIEADLVDCMVALPGQLFYSTQIPVCLWFLARDKKGEGGRVKGENESSNFKLHSSNFRARKGETLFIDARKLGTMIDRVHRELTDEDVRIIADTYHAWISLKGEMRSVKYADVPGFCKSATLDDIRHHGHILTPGRYVGAAEVEDDGEPFEEKMARLTAELRTQTVESARLDTLIWANLRSLKLEG